MSKIVSGAFIFMTLFFVNAIGGKVEGYMWPVVTPAIIVDYEAVGETRTRFWGESVKLRNCSFNHLAWFLANQGYKSRADLVFEDGTKIRDDGTFSFGPWLVQLTPDQLLQRSYAVVYHRCHIFWLTETRIYG